MGAGCGMAAGRQHVGFRRGRVDAGLRPPSGPRRKMGERGEALVGLVAGLAPLKIVGGSGAALDVVANVAAAEVSWKGSPVTAVSAWASRHPWPSPGRSPRHPLGLGREVEDA